MSNRLLSALLLCLVVTAIGLAQVAVPPAPTNLVAAQSPDAIPVAKLTWTAPTGTYGFAVYRSVDDTLHFQRIAYVNAAAYLDRSVKIGYTYFYYVTTVMLSNASASLSESAPSNIAKISFAAADRPTGVIAGTVRDDSTGKPIQGVHILFFRMRATVMTIDVPSAVTDSLGQYSAKLDTGVYKINAQPAPWMPPGPPAYAAEWYDNKKDMATADPVTVIQNASVVANFGLSRPVVPPAVRGTITGTVIDDSSKLPLRGILIRFYRKAVTSINWQPTAVTDSLGVYSATLDTGTYLIRAEGSIVATAHIVYQPEWFDNVTEVSLATPVKVTNGSLFTADFGLSKPVPPTYASIQGTVTDTLGNVLRHATVVIMRSLQELNASTLSATVASALDAENALLDGVGFCRGVIWSGKTDSLGKYKATVATGHAYVAMAAKLGYMPEYYNNEADPLLADPITVTGDVSNINFSLAPNPLQQNSISGVVRDSAGTGVPSIVVLIPLSPNKSQARLRFGHTDSTGAYTIGEVLLGTYVVMAVPFHGYAPAFYKAGAYGVMRWQDADSVLVSGNISGINIGVIAVQMNGFVRLRGHILAGGAALRGVLVTASTTGGQSLGSAITDQTGAYAIEALPEGSVILTADRQTYSSSQKTVTVTGDQYDISGVDFALQTEGTTSVAAEGTLPVAYTLDQNYPNPFNPSTTIIFELPANGFATLTVFNTLGQEVRTLVSGLLAAGQSKVVWNATDQHGRMVASGVYFYRLTVKSGDKEIFSSVKKMLLVR